MRASIEEWNNIRKKLFVALGKKHYLQRYKHQHAYVYVCIYVCMYVCMYVFLRIIAIEYDEYKYINSLMIKNIGMA